MNLPFQRKGLAACAAIFLAAQILAANTNGPATVTRDELTSNYLQIQEQLHAAQLAIEQNQEAALETSQSNALVLAQRLQALEDTVATQRENDAAAAHKSQQLTLLMLGSFGLLGLGLMLMMVYFQWRAFTQLAEISARQHTAISNGEVVHELAGPGRATVDASATQLLGVVDRLEQRINELENGQRLLPEMGTTQPKDLAAEGQKHLDSNAPLKALECFDKLLASQPNRADAVAMRSAALEKLGRDDEALAGYNRAIAMDPSQVIAHLHKGGLLNRLRRYDEALNCYEQALLGQEKKAKG